MNAIEIYMLKQQHEAALAQLAEIRNALGGHEDSDLVDLARWHARQAAILAALLEGGAVTEAQIVEAGREL